MMPAGDGGCPSAQALTPSSAAHRSTCAAPRPNTTRRMTHSRVGCSSSPMMNSSSTMPNSRHLQDAADVADEIQAPRADHKAGGHVAEDRAQAQEAEQRHRDDGGGQQNRGLGKGDHEAGGDSGRNSAAAFTLEFAAPRPHACAMLDNEPQRRRQRPRRPHDRAAGCLFRRRGGRRRRRGSRGRQRLRRRRGPRQRGRAAARAPASW